MQSGLGAANIRLVEPEDDTILEPAEVTINSDDIGDVPEFDKQGNVLKINHADGSITVSLDGKPIEESKNEKVTSWYSNLAEVIDDDELSRISDILLLGVADDLASRIDWIDDRAQGIRLLGLRLEIPGLGSSVDGAPLEGMSKYRDPLLQEAVLRFQANARSEMLPTDGPVKIRDDASSSEESKDRLADAFEKDFNHYLTVTDPDYYHDTDRMFLLLGFGGTTFKKVYTCPIRNRPVSETVDADDLIVNNGAVGLLSAKRVTHRIDMNPNTIKRMQILGVYIDQELSTPIPKQLDAAQEEKKAQQGVATFTQNPDDLDREVYEIYTELDIKGFEHRHKGKKSGLEIPYRVTIDVSSKQILSIVRNYKKETKELPVAKKTFVKYTYVPGFGFYDIGLLHILGNTTNAITASTRELLDAGMYANFPGFLLSKSGARQQTTTFRIPPGGSAIVDTNGMKISDAIMPLPYKEPSNALMTLTEALSQKGQRVGGTAEMQVGEGRANAPVGTTLALIEQATIVLNSVHKRMHSSQSQELQLIAECFRENPETFWKHNKSPAHPWDPVSFMKALNTFSLTPQSDPNTSSHGQRVAKVMALKQLQAANPGDYDSIAVDRAALRTIGWSNPDQFFKPQAQRNQPPPEAQQAMAETMIKKQDADTRKTLADAQIQKLSQPEAPQDKGIGAADIGNMQIKILAEKTKLAIAQMGLEREKISDASRDSDRQADLAIQQSRSDIERMRMQEQGLQKEASESRSHDVDLIKTSAKIEIENNKAHSQHDHDMLMDERAHMHEHEVLDKEHKHQKIIAMMNAETSDGVKGGGSNE